MATLLNSNGINKEIDGIINTANEYLIIVSPYLKISEYHLSNLRLAEKREIPIVIFYGKEALNSKEEKKLKTLNNINLYYLDNLHSKFYMNEEEAIVGSMNFHEYSQANNWEMAVLLYDSSNLEELKCEVDRMIEIADVKTENFQIARLVKPKFNPKIATLLNEHYQINGFKNADLENSFGMTSSVKTITYCRHFPLDYIDLEIKKYGQRIDFVLKMEMNELKKLDKILKIDSNSGQYIEQYRCFHNTYKCLSLYVSEEDRDNWSDYSHERRIEIMVEGINLMMEYIEMNVDKLHNPPKFFHFHRPFLKRWVSKIKLNF